MYLDIQQLNRPGPELGRVRGVQIAQVSCATRGRIVMTAQDGSFLEDVTLRDVVLEVPEIEDPSAVVPANPSMQMSNFNPVTRAARAAVVADNARGLRLENVAVTWPAAPTVPMDGLRARRVESAVVDAPRLGPSSTSAAARRTRLSDSVFGPPPSASGRPPRGVSRARTGRGRRAARRARRPPRASRS